MEGISVIIPVYNEELNVSEGYAEVKGVLSSMNMPHEIIYIDDGSKDKTVQYLSELAKKDPSLRVIQFRKNFGQTAAMAA
jgi:glycosyltransferase involved in cell wall biosynthesis